MFTYFINEFANNIFFKLNYKTYIFFRENAKVTFYNHFYRNRHIAHISFVEFELKF